MMVNTVGQISAKRKKKFTGGNASKRHRDRVNIEFNNLAKLLPFPENVIAKLDKSSILRLAVSYIRAKSFFKDALPLNGEDQPVDKTKLANKDDLYKGLLEETCITEFFLQALDGFLIVITEDLKVLYVSESVREYLGYCQAGIIHESFLQFIHWGDEDNIKNALRFDPHQNGNSSHVIKENEKRNQMKNGKEEVKNGKKELNGIITEPTFSSRVQSRRFICRMKCAFSCSSRFYTAFQAFQFSGHIRRSTIQEGKEQRTLNTLIAFGSPLNSSKIDPRDLVSDSFDETRSTFDESDSNGSVKMIGLHIEPRLRPHIAPIPIAQNESDGKVNHQNPHQYSLSRRFSIGAHPDAHFNGNYNHGARICSPYHHIAHDYYRDGLRFANGWNGRSSSLSNSPISDASSPRGIKRSASADASPESSDMINRRKLTRFEGPVFAQSKNGFNSMPLDDIHSSARILMQLKATQRRLSDNGHLPNESESDSNCSDDRGELYRSENSYEYMSKEHVFVDRPYPSVFAAKFDAARGYGFDMNGRAFGASCIPNGKSFGTNQKDRGQRTLVPTNGTDERFNEDFIRERIMQCKLSPNGVKDNRHFSARNLSSRTSPERVSKSQIYLSRYSPINGIETSLSSRQSPPKKELNKGFHISTILGLEDESAQLPVAGQRVSDEGKYVPLSGTKSEVYNEKRITANGSPRVGKSVDSASSTERRLSDDSVNARLSDAVAEKERLRRSADLPLKKGSSGDKEGGKRDLDGLNKEVHNMDDIKTSFAHLLQGFTATIARSIDRSIDTIFKP